MACSESLAPGFPARLYLLLELTAAPARSSLLLLVLTAHLAPCAVLLILGEGYYPYRYGVYP
jgi:hypothetical protein